MMDNGKLLESWKEIASYLGRSVRACQQWEQELGLPVHRLDSSPKARVYAYKDELDRWLADKLHTADISPPGADAQKAVLEQGRGKTKVTWRRISVAVMALGMMAAVAIHFSAPPSEVCVAVLPFDISSMDQELIGLRGRFAESIRTGFSLMRIPVISPDACERIMASPGRQRILKKMKVTHYVSGQVFIDRKDAHIDIHLIQVRDERIQKTLVYDADIENLFPGAVNTMTAELVEFLHKPLEEPQYELLRKRTPRNLEAVLAYRKGLAAFDMLGLDQSEEEFESARGWFQNVLELDPDFSPAWAAMGTLYEGRYVQTNHPADLEAMVRHFGIALERDPALPQAQAGMGWVFFHQKKFDEAYEQFKKALELDPNDPISHIWAGSFLRSIGLDKPAIRHYLRALELDPLNGSIYLLCGASHHHIGKNRRALAYYQKARKILGDEPEILLLEVRSLAMMRRLDEAEEVLQRVNRIEPADSVFRPSIKRKQILLSALRNERDPALADLGLEQGSCRYDITAALSVLGMKDQAIRLIRYGNEHGFELIKDFLYPYPYLKTNPFFRNLRSDPRFKGILRAEMGRYNENMMKFGDL